MSIWKRGLFLLSLAALIAGAVWIPFRTPLTERLCVLFYGCGDRVYQWAGAGENGLICAASRDGASRVLSSSRQEDGVELRFLNQRGDMLSDWTASLPDAALKGEMCGLYPVDRQTAFLSFWQEDEAGALSLCVYRAARGEMTEAVLNVPGAGQSQSERRSSVCVSDFSRDVDQVFFAILHPDRVTGYSCPISGGSAVRVEEQVRGDLRSAAVLPGGGLVISGQGFLIVPGRQNYGVSQGQVFSRICCSSKGIYCVESQTLTAWFSDVTGSSIQQLFSLDSLVTEHWVNSLVMTPEGNALLLRDAHTLTLDTGGDLEELTPALYPSRWNSLLAVIFWLGGTLFLTFLIWEILSIVSQNRIPLSLYWGTVTVSLLLVLGCVAWYSILVPQGIISALDRRGELVSSATGLALRAWTGVLDTPDNVSLTGYQDNAVLGVSEASRENTAALTGLAESILAESRAGDFRCFHLIRARHQGQGWFLEDGTRAELDPCFNANIAEFAERETDAVGHDGERFWYSRAWGGQVLCVNVIFGYGDASVLVDDTWQVIRGWCLAAAGCMLFIFLLINADVRRLASALERYASGTPWKRLRLKSGDELEGMAASLNALAASRTEEDARRNALVESYRRFVPEPVISLLGKKSVLEVEEGSFAIRNMAVMTVSFFFSSTMYTDNENTRLMFESVNQVIEHTASIASRNGGTVFNFNFDGYDVAFEDTSRAVSTAVAIGQEVLSLNSARTRDGLSAVTLRMALDAGTVVVGIVGDGEHLEQTTISARFSTVRSLIRLCGKLDAGILCTEAAVSGAEGYGSRYVGRCRVEQDTVRVYEIFDADPYGTRTEKASTLRRFSQGVLNLYSGDLAKAKRAFLELAHETPTDGGARYYLYLADQLAQNPDQPCELNPDA